MITDEVDFRKRNIIRNKEEHFTLIKVSMHPRDIIIYYGPNCVPLNPHSYLKAIAPNVTIFGDGVFRRQLGLKGGHKGGALNPTGTYK